ncbi:MAG TPA: hypothetical protein PK723_04355 [Candidatus Pacearchaeota archaeon]|nr:hypothetical protein [Candidatus Pacearchaeota archaeon]
MKEFFSDVCKINAKAIVDCEALYAAYILWCIDKHAEPCTRKELGGFIKAQGVIKKSGRYGQTFWEGVEISEEYKRKLKRIGHYEEVQF